MNKNIKAFMVVTLSIVMFLLTVSGTALAFKTFNGHKLNYGVGGYGYSPRYYFLTDSVYNNSTYAPLVRNAMSDWIYTTSRLGITTPIYWGETRTQLSSVMDVYYNTYPTFPPGALAATQFFNSSGAPLSIGSTNWHWSKILLDKPDIDALSSYNKQGTIAHEMGHVMGLDHTSLPQNPNSVMCQMGYGRLVNAAQADDVNGINYLYDDTLSSGETLYGANYIYSSNHLFKLRYQTDGNLVLYRTRDNAALWSSGTHGTSVGRTAMQTDGNLVIYDGNNIYRWASWTNGSPSRRLVMQTDGNLVIYDANNVPRWWTGTNGQY